MAGLQHTLGDLGRAVGRLNQDIATLGTESRGDSLSESVDTLEELGTSFDTELEVLQHKVMLAGGTGRGASGAAEETLCHPCGCSNGFIASSRTYLMSKTLLLQVEASGPGDRGTLSGRGEERGPGRKSSLHYGGDEVRAKLLSTEQR